MKLALIFIFLLVSQLSLSSEVDDLLKEVSTSTKLSNTHLRLLREELKIQNIIIEGVKQIQLDTGNFKDPGNIESTLERIIRKSILAKSESLSDKVRFEIKDILNTKIDKSGTQKFLKKYLNAFAQKIKSQGILMSSITRRYGIQVGLVYFASLQIDLTYPLILIASGNVAKGVGLMSVPFSPMIAGSFASLKSFIKKRNLMKKLGFEKFKASTSNSKFIRRFFNQNFLEAKNLIEVNINKKSYIVSLEERNLLRDVFLRKNYDQRVNYKKLIEFLEKENLLTSNMKLIKESGDTNLVKSLKLLFEIEHNVDVETFQRVQQRFSKSIKEVQGLYNSDLHRRWLTKVAHAQSFEDLIRYLNELPPDFPPTIFDRVWREYVIPNLSKNIKSYGSLNHLKAFQNLSNLWDEIFRKEMFHNPNYNLPKTFKKDFADYIYKSLAPVGACGMAFSPKKGSVPLF